MPREAIRLSALALEVALSHDHLTVEGGDLDEALRRFSRERLDDLSSEFRFKLPGLQHVLRKFRGREKEFPIDVVQEVAIQLEIDLDETANPEWAWVRGYSDDPIQLARVLLECGFLLFKDSRTSRPLPYDADVHSHIPDRAWFAIHPMFESGLGLEGAV